MEPFDVQLYRFMVMALAGVVCGFVFDLYRVFRWLTRPKGVIVLLEDLLFWLLITAWVVLALYWGNWLDLRLYVIIGIGIGAAAYLYMASPLILKVLTKVIYALEKAIGFSSNIVRRVISVVLLPIGFLYNAVTWPFKEATRALRIASARLWTSLSPPKVPPDE